MKDSNNTNFLNKLAYNTAFGLGLGLAMACGYFLTRDVDDDDAEKEPTSGRYSWGSTSANSAKKYTLADAVKAIDNSSMWSTDKEEAIEVICNGSHDSSYYEAVCVIASSTTMWSDDMLDAIEAL